jgi:hypothetical protein
MTKEQLEKHNKEAAEEWARLERTYTRQVLFEKHEPFRLLIKKGWLDKDWKEKQL